MTQVTGEITAKQLLSMPDDGNRYELVKGVLRMMSPAGNEHGRVTVRLTWRVAQYVEQQDLGVVFAAETGFLIDSDPDTIRAPDLAFLTKARWTEAGRVDGYWPGAPDLVAEVVSPNDSYSEVEEKALRWLAAGTQVVWIIDPRQKHVTVYRDRDNIVVLTGDAALSDPDLLPGWQVPLSDLFG